MSDQTTNQEPNPFGDFPKRWRASENGAPLPVQREYLDYHRYVDPEQCMQADVAETGKALFSHKATVEEKKKALAILAHNGTVETYRTLEEYAEQAEEELAGWVALALHECQAFLEASLEDASVGMVMGGLGGTGDKIRYSVAVRAKNGCEFARTEQAAIVVPHDRATSTPDVSRRYPGRRPCGAMGYEWSGVTQQQKAAGNVVPLIFALAIVMVFLFLAAQYESWATPLSVLLSVPMAILGAALFTLLRGFDLNLIHPG